MPGPKEKRIAVVGAGIAGLRCAAILNKHFEVEIFEAAKKMKESRPLQMEGGVHYCEFVPDLAPTHTLKKMVFFSENRSFTWEGRMGFTYKIGGTDGLDARLRQRLEKEIKIHYNNRITSLDELNEFDIIIAADGFRSRIAMLAGMRKPQPKMWGVGIGSMVKGEFNVGAMECTFNTEVAPGGYRYLIPISKNEATLASASIAKKENYKNVREKLREFANCREYEIINEWTDFEKWYNFDAYQRDNIYLIGGAASFTEPCFGFGLKYSIGSARLCAQAIINNRDYNVLLKPMLKELNYWEKIGKWFLFATNKKYDRMMRLANIFFIRNRAQRGKSIKSFYRLLRLF